MEEQARRESEMTEFRGERLASPKAGRYCGNCGNEMSPEDGSCRDCGTTREASATTVPTPEADVSVPPLPNFTTQGGMVVVTQLKSMTVAYVLWLFLGQLGLHRLYLGRTGSGITQMLLCLVGWATVVFVVGFVPLVVLWVWLLVDLFLTAGMVRDTNQKIMAAAQ